MKIIVPSLHRAGISNSMKWLREANRSIYFAIHADEVEDYKKAYPDIPALILSDDCRHHTGLVRKEIMQQIREPFFFVDDDIRISLKVIPSICAIFDLLAVRNKFLATVCGIDPVIFDNCPLEQLPVYEDVALVIHAIQSGGGTIVSYVATHNNVSAPGGGCNLWRNKEITVKSLETLVKLYPDVCSIRETANTTHSQYIGIGLRVAWSKIRKLS